MRSSACFLAVLLLPGLAGCTILQEPQARELSGPTDGYTPTASFLKLHVKRDDGSLALLDFDRRDWYTAEIARLVDHKQLEFVSARAMPRDILNEYVAQNVTSPEELRGLRYDEMAVTAQERDRMDAEYEALLRERLEKTPGTPASLLPDDALP